MNPAPPFAVGPLARTVLSAFVLLHLVASAAHYGRDTAVGRTLRQHTRDYETAVGLSQNWNMFAPNPPRSEIWLETEVLTTTGEWVASPRVTSSPTGPIRFQYWRGGKEERYLFEDDKIGLRRRKTARICAAAAARGEPVSGVRYTRVWQRTPKPADARRGIEGEFKRKFLDQHWCKP